MSDPVRYWLLIGEVPSGPFAVAEVHAKLAAHEATWETPACAVGGGTWLPLVRTPGVGPAGAAGDGASHPQPASNPPSPQSGRKRVPESLGAVLVLLVLGGIIWRAGCTGDKSGRETAGVPARPVPEEYRPYLRDGKVVPTGHASLDYWVHINVFLETIQGPQNNLTVPGTFQSMAKFIREKSVTGVDPDLAAWAKRVADHLETKASIVTQLNDPATVRQARESVAAGQADPMFALEQAVTEWERNRERLRAEGIALQQTLSQRHARTFPSPQL
ncbi:hypothetical protein [Frigoriglobus tundricola]|uniref:GYF domain-containing protein n=1 Tax=Frigoriglobus tundricola TaxID=2774151 RepID=A0A6M5YGK4_9BACT|nr:hypothetical protein [Frigoriglobus tundricola]QJW93145.1 hypothetical protein FTUN_0650 [Frigoriglobus tundricola]